MSQLNAFIPGAVAFADVFQGRGSVSSVCLPLVALALSSALPCLICHHCNSCSCFSPSAHCRWNALKIFNNPKCSWYVIGAVSVESMRPFKTFKTNLRSAVFQWRWWVRHYKWRAELPIATKSIYAQGRDVCILRAALWTSMFLCLPKYSVCLLCIYLSLCLHHINILDLWYLCSFY